MAVAVSTLNISKTFGHHRLFGGVSVSVDARERLALIGPNGSGKSTLLKILAGLENADEGSVSLRKGVRPAYVAQSDEFPEGSTVLSAVVDGLHGVTIASIHDEHERELHAELVLRRLGFDELGLGEDFLHVATSTLSGGQRKRLAIARGLATEPDLLMLDEPTNHLDVEGIGWLEELLRSASFAWIAVTHDRAFLEGTASRIIELSRAYPGGVFAAQGNYTEFLRRKQEFLDGQARQEQALANTVREDLRWLSRGAQARRTKSKSRIEASYERMDELAVLRGRNAEMRAAGIDFTGTDRKTQKLLMARGVSKTLGGKKLFEDLDVVLSPGQVLGLMGPNGSGKSTLIGVLTGDLSSDPPSAAALEEARRANLPSGVPEPGEVRRADGLKVVVFSQHRRELDPSMTLRDTLSPADSVVYRGKLVHVNTWASRFLFTTEQMKAPVRALSGGERARIHIARLMLEAADVLVLDEPTNDLDIASLEVLEESLEDFPGAIVLVTHDRAMLSRLATQVLALDGRGGARYFADYEQWEKVTGAEGIAKSSAASDSKPEAPDSSPTPPRPSPQGGGSKKKLSYKEQRELAEIEGKIEAAEAVVKSLETESASPSALQDHRAVSELYAKLGAAQAEVHRLYERWAELGG
jgi:ATP-binding cassette subfamily F protein uup